MSLRSITFCSCLTLLLLLPFKLQAATILVWGDSLSAGHGLKQGEDWPALLQIRLRHEGLQHTVINASMSGETSAGGRTRLPAALQQHRPDIFILELGANDGLRGLPTNQLGENLATMIEAAHQQGAQVLLIGMEIPPNYGPVYTRQFRQIFTDTASHHDLAFLPFLLDSLQERHLFMEDGLHPTAAAQPLILENVWPLLLPLLKP